MLRALFLNCFKLKSTVSKQRAEELSLEAQQASQPAAVELAAHTALQQQPCSWGCLAWRSLTEELISVQNYLMGDVRSRGQSQALFRGARDTTKGTQQVGHRKLSEHFVTTWPTALAQGAPRDCRASCSQTSTAMWARRRATCSGCPAWAGHSTTNPEVPSCASPYQQSCFSHQNISHYFWKCKSAFQFLLRRSPP